jgi:hypothetical protein
MFEYWRIQPNTARREAIPSTKLVHGVPGAETFEAAEDTPQTALNKITPTCHFFSAV